MLQAALDTPGPVGKGNVGNGKTRGWVFHQQKYGMSQARNRGFFEPKRGNVECLVDGFVEGM